MTTQQAMGYDFPDTTSSYCDCTEHLFTTKRNSKKQSKNAWAKPRFSNGQSLNSFFRKNLLTRNKRQPNWQFLGAPSGDKWTPFPRHGSLSYRVLYLHNPFGEQRFASKIVVVSRKLANSAAKLGSRRTLFHG